MKLIPSILEYIGKFGLTAFFFSLNFSFAQSSKVELLEFDASKCITPSTDSLLVKQSWQGDTLKLSFIGSGNCTGLNTPSVRVSSDSVMIKTQYGKQDTVPFDELSAETKAFYLKKNKDSLPEYLVYTELSTCFCSYLFDVKLTGLDQKTSYQYYFMDRKLYMIDRYITPEIYALQNDYFDVSINQIEEEVRSMLKTKKWLDTMHFTYKLIVHPGHKKTIAHHLVKGRKYARLERKIVDYYISHFTNQPLDIDINNRLPSNVYIETYYLKEENIMLISVKAVTRM